jgi:hypothetical protein
MLSILMLVTNLLPYCNDIIDNMKRCYHITIFSDITNEAKMVTALLQSYPKEKLFPKKTLQRLHGYIEVYRC